jgi:hypothetical protein
MQKILKTRGSLAKFGICATVSLASLAMVGYIGLYI